MTVGIAQHHSCRPFITRIHSDDNASVAPRDPAGNVDVAQACGIVYPLDCYANCYWLVVWFSLIVSIPWSVAVAFSRVTCYPISTTKTRINE